MNEYSPSGSTPLPPPPPERPTPRSAPPSTQPSRILGLLGIAGLAIAAVVTLLWLSARGDASDLRAERDAAVTEQNLTAAAADQTRSDLADAQAALSSTRAELDELRANSASSPDVQARIAELETLAADQSQQVSDLSAANETLQNDLAAAQQAATDAEAALAQAQADAAVAEAAAEAEPAETAAADDTVPVDETVDPPAEPVPDGPVVIQTAPAGRVFDASGNPDFARYIGELLSSRTGSSRLSQAQSTCFGTEVLKVVGLDGFGAGLYLAATSDANNALVGAMQQAAGICNIDQSLIFG